MKEVWNEILEGIGHRALILSIAFMLLMLLGAMIFCYFFNESFVSHLENIHNLNFETI